MKPWTFMMLLKASIRLPLALLTAAPLVFLLDIEVAEAAEVAANKGAEVLMTPQQQKNMGITVAALGSVIQSATTASNGASTAGVTRRFPAEVSIPVSQERVISAPQAGLVDQLFVAAGQLVKKGQPLAHISSQELVGMQRDYLQALTQKKLADQSLARDEELFQDGIIAKRRYLETQSQHEEVAANLAQRQQALRLAGMGDGAIGKLNKPSSMSGGMTLSATMDGQVLEQMVAVGQRVDMATPLYRVARLTPLWLEIHAPLEGLPNLILGMPVGVANTAIRGKLIAIVRSVNKADQTLLLRAEVQQGAEKLSPGQLVEAEILLADNGNTKRVPKSALVRRGKDTWVFVQSKQGFLPTQVSVISEQGQEAIVEGPLANNANIAVTGTTALKGSWIGLGAE